MHFVGYLYIIDLINARKTAHIKTLRNISVGLYDLRNAAYRSATDCVTLRVSLQAFHRTVSSASSNMCGMHRQGTQQLTLLLCLQLRLVAPVARLFFDRHVAVSESLARWGRPATWCREDRGAWRTGNDVGTARNCLQGLTNTALILGSAVFQARFEQRIFRIHFRIIAWTPRLLPHGSGK